MAYKRRISDLSEYRKEYKVRGGVEMTVEGELWHTKEEFLIKTNIEKNTRLVEELR